MACLIVENQFITRRWQSRLLAYWWPQRDYYTNVCSSVIGHTFHLPGRYQSLITEPHCARNLTFRYEENPKKMQNVKNWFWVSFTWCAGMHVPWRIVRTFRHFCANCQEINIMCRHMLYFCWNCAQKCFNCPYLSFAQARHLKSSSYIFLDAVFAFDLE